ncbi:transcription factor bHLH36-like [Prosopis cineraria]|uniref:transcription factor bHLH36-like n=1 Tax=Prosopis cineraria TaxID=364024 RepID=UPI00240F7920|nr:transcription factor bHLH36-like [Prosopis cineraria]
MMKPLHPVGDEDLFFMIPFQNPSPLSIQTIPEDDIFHDPAEVKAYESFPPNFGSEVIPKGRGKQQQNKEFPVKTAEDANKKWMHRETERQRRQEMATLCASIRLALPLEYIRGKRSASDQIDGAVKYIKHLENKVKQLMAKRDELMKNGNGISVIIHPYQGGAEINCSYRFREYLFTQSTLLSILIKEGLNVVSCTSIKRDETFIHTIRLEVSDIGESTTDHSELQRRLTAAILSTEHRDTASEPENC